LKSKDRAKDVGININVENDKVSGTKRRRRRRREILANNDHDTEELEVSNI